MTTSTDERRVVVALPGAEPEATALAAALGAPLGDLRARRFPDGERWLRLASDVADRDVVLVGRMVPPDEHALTLRFATDLLVESGAARVDLVLPYLPYMRQDKRFQPGEAITSESFARFVSGCVDGLLTVDPHLHRHATLAEIYDVPARVVPAAPVLARWLAQHVPDAVVVGPDEESAQWVEQVARLAGVGALVARKERRGDRDVRITLPPGASTVMAGRTPVILDDILSSGRTMVVAVRAVIEAGGAAPTCVAVHGLFADDALPLLREAGAARVLTTNTVPGACAAIDVLPSIAQALKDGLLTVPT